MKLLSLFKKQQLVEAAVLDPEIDPDALVKKIHKEVDSLDIKFEQEYKKMLEELEIPTETQVIRKAEKLAKLGVSKNNIIVKESEQLRLSIEAAKNQQNKYKQLLYKQNRYKETYPLDKIVSLEDFNKVINKYNLVYSTIDNYIKDIPEKNIDEILNVKETLIMDKPEKTYFLTGLHFEFRLSTPNNVKKAAEQAIDFINKMGGVIKIKQDYYNDIVESFPHINQELLKDALYGSQRDIHVVDNDKLFIAAPKSHFNLENGIFDGKQLIIKPEIKKSTITEIKDPIAFFMLKGDFVRIVSKWGTSDDQSYLDPIVQNEKLN